jgi:hypothetical protein
MNGFYGPALRPAMIASSNGPRASIFSYGTTDSFGLGAARIGQRADVDWYNQAKAEVAEFDALTKRARKIANVQVRERVYAEHVGDPSDPESGAYRRNSVMANVAEAEGQTPRTYATFAEERVRNRVRKLQDVTHAFRRAVEEAEAQWGSLPAPQVIERIVTVPGAAPNILPYVLTAGVVVIGLALLGVFGDL